MTNRNPFNISIKTYFQPLILNLQCCRSQINIIVTFDIFARIMSSTVIDQCLTFNNKHTDYQLEVLNAENVHLVLLRVLEYLPIEQLHPENNYK